MCVHFGNARWSHAETMHGSISADCAVGTKYYLAVRRSWSWLGRRLQCMWTHIVQITIPITLWIAIRNVFRSVIRSHVNTATISWICLFIMTDWESMYKRPPHSVRFSSALLSPTVTRGEIKGFVVAQKNSRGQSALVEKPTMHNLTCWIFMRQDLIPCDVIIVFTWFTMIINPFRTKTPNIYS